MGDYRLKQLADSMQNLLPLDETPTLAKTPPIKESSSKTEPRDMATALLGVISELPSRYSPDGLAASVGAERVGLAGWIIDNRLGRDAEPDEETVKMVIADLLGSGLIEITETRRMKATEKGAHLWQSLK